MIAGVTCSCGWQVHILDSTTIASVTEMVRHWLAGHQVLSRRSCTNGITRQARVLATVRGWREKVGLDPADAPWPGPSAA